MRVFVLLCVFAACAETPSPTADPAALDPTGTWKVDATWGKGTCGADYAWKASFVVTPSDTGWDVFDAIYNAPPTSSDVACTTDSCVLTVGDDWPADGDGTLRLEMALVMRSSGAITAIGSAKVTGTTTCDQAFAAVGSISR